MNNLKQIALKYKTPSYVFDIKSLSDRISNIKEIFKDIRLCYAIKANPFLTKYIANQVDKLEVCSPGELKICISQEIEASKILYSGVVKETDDIAEAIKYGVTTLTAESKNQLKLINNTAKDLNKTIFIMLRINTQSQFGMSQDEMIDILNHKDSYKNVTIVGLHYFIGTQRKKQNQQEDDIKNIEKILKKIKQECNFDFTELEYGPGLAMPIFIDDDFCDTLLPAKKLKECIDKSKLKIKITIELGRFLVQECGQYLTQVNEIKSVGDVNYCFIDGGINHVNYIGSAMGMKTPVIEHVKCTNSTTPPPRITKNKQYCICGSLCTTNDILARRINLEDVSIGDILIFKNIGAYSVTEGIYMFLSRTMPQILIKNNEKITIARNFTETFNLNC
ncbi:2-[(L-alanin-3-ylcarbamoyl)methyl]-2-hydroxybutanedioate decarboxylase [Campylobacter majalis]|uniref:2-[(L-alanin-3-ylcarbamoyl)methyl]-2-hydroxybutanedioate decarboxylase n=1 Tax=Campylobacter majalis TaxID=2790656 RepID=A0ABM8Q8Z4_9BACT|nr:alanine racemase [Campylobacter majalis]CAD7289350.1 2-[(L-alanin-3-ylcarbamoyl)methyl]-2-hydroxybutanedioate decarboxylase [Campylobacter majalis]